MMDAPSVGPVAGGRRERQLYSRLRPLRVPTHACAHARTHTLVRVSPLYALNLLVTFVMVQSCAFLIHPGLEYSRALGLVCA